MLASVTVPSKVFCEINRLQETSNTTESIYFIGFDLKLNNVLFEKIKSILVGREVQNEDFDIHLKTDNLSGFPTIFQEYQEFGKRFVGL